MHDKKLFYREKENGDSFHVAVCFVKPYRRNDKGGRRYFYFNILPSLWVASADNYFGGGKYMWCQTTINFSWLFFYIYIETFKTVKGGVDL